MHYVNVLILFILISIKSFSQDEFIDRYNNQISDFDLKIKSVTKDTLLYKAFGKTKKIALKEIYAYRFKKSNWIYPDSIHKKYGYVYYGRFGLTYLRPEFILKSYYYGIKDDEFMFRQDYKVVFHLDSNKTRTLKDNREISFKLADDSLNAEFICELYKIVKDTIVIRANYGFDNKNKFWKIPFDKISYVDFQTNAQKAVKITTGVVFSAITLGLGGGIVPGIKVKSKFDINSEKNYEFIKYDKKEW